MAPDEHARGLNGLEVNVVTELNAWKRKEVIPVFTEANLTHIFYATYPYLGVISGSY